MAVGGLGGGAMKREPPCRGETEANKEAEGGKEGGYRLTDGAAQCERVQEMPTQRR